MHLMLFFTTFISTNESLSSKAKRSLSRLYLRRRPIYGGSFLARDKATQSLETVAWAKAKGEFCEHLQEIARQQIQRFLQDLLEQEAMELLGRQKYQRKGNPLEEKGYRNRHGKVRRFTLSLGTVEVKRPRVRNLEERDASRFLDSD